MGNRIEAVDAKGDIKKAFAKWDDQWLAAVGSEGASDADLRAEREMLDARSRVMAWLSQVEQDAKRLDACMSALEAVVDHGDANSLKQALVAMGRHTN